MGIVYEVARRPDGKRFAMKVLSGMSGALDMARFAREAQIASQVSHPNVVAIADIDVARSGVIFIVMELVAGPSLLDLQGRYGDRAFALDVLAQIAGGLAAIHETGIVHRDLKPANVLVKEDATGLLVKISDFGVSTIAGPDASVRPPAENDAPATIPEPHERAAAQSPGGSPLTETGVLLGTPIYMAPELAFGAKDAQPSCDVFSLGVIAHELLRGVRPWAESPAFTRMRGETLAAAPAIGGVCAGLDAEVAAAIDACLRDEPEERPQAKDVARLLGNAALRVRASK
jgi:serine/threonine-protein kinase